MATLSVTATVLAVELRTLMTESALVSLDDGTYVPLLHTGHVNDLLVSQLMLEVEYCDWAPSRCFNGAAFDCELPMTNITRQIAKLLLSLALPSECPTATLVDTMQTLPIRRFPVGAAEDSHIDSGPGSTMLLHLSHGTTRFHHDDRRTDLRHAPGDAMVWWNTGMTPLHSWASSAVAPKFVVNFGTTAHGPLQCEGMTFTAAGCPDFGPDIAGLPCMVWIPFVCCGVIAAGILVGILALAVPEGNMMWYAGLSPLYLLSLMCCLCQCGALWARFREKHREPPHAAAQPVVRERVVPGAICNSGDSSKLSGGVADTPQEMDTSSARDVVLQMPLEAETPA